LASTFRGLRPAASLKSYLANPLGCYIAGAHAAAFWASAVLSGVSLWGYPNDADVELLTSAFSDAISLSFSCHASLIDLRNLEILDLRTFDKLWSNLRSHFTALGRFATRLALLAPRGATRMISELFRSLRPGNSVRSFSDGVAALAWIGIGDGALLEDLDRLSRASPIERSVLGEVRRLLAKHPVSRAEQLARQLGISQRTLQRRLCELGTSIRDEVNAAHVQLAKTLMRETDNPLKWIAIESGYSSLQHFSSSFRARVGMSPSRWRASE
jgi:AraC-like DNA-binding protein